MNEYDEACEEDQRKRFDVFVQALEGADRVAIETRNALGDFDASYMLAPNLLTESKALKAQLEAANEALVWYEYAVRQFATAIDDRAVDAEEALDKDRGKKARTALAELKREAP